MIKVIIPAAKLVPEELQQIGKLPAIIYPINQDIVFDYLLEQYEEISSSIDVLCYEKADKVHHRLANYGSDKINVIDLPLLEDLGHTIYFGLTSSSTPVIINFADTIVLDNIYSNVGDCFYYTEDYLSETWTYFKEKNGVITEIFDKIPDETNSKKREKLFVGVFQISDGLEFRKSLKKAFSCSRTRNGISTFYYALQLYSQTHPMQAIKTDNWFDIGHIDKYYNSILEVKAREFNHITIDKNRGILRKTSDDKEKFIGEILWYLKLPADISYSRPRIFSHSTSYENLYVEMEYYSYHTVHELFLYGDLTYNQWRDVFRRIQFICNDYKRYQVKDVNIKAALEDMYLKKTVDRLNKLKDNEMFSEFFKNPMHINDTKYKSLDEICGLLHVEIPKMLYDVEAFNIIHGDLCFANIMIDSNYSIIKVIDPRGKFGPYDIYGDFRYELAKIFHSVDGKYDFIIKDLFSINANPEEAVIEFRVSDRNRDFDLSELFFEVFKKEIGNDRKKIELIEALLFLSMIPLHGESLDHQFAMLSTGIEILDRVLDIRA